MSRILIVDNDFSYFLSHRLPIAKACSQEGWEVYLATPNSDNAAEEAEKHGLQWHGIEMDLASQNPFNELKSIWNLKNLYKYLQPDLVHHLKVKPVLYGSVSARLAEVPAVINTLTGLGYLFMNHNIKNRIIRSLANCLFRYGFNHPNSYLILQNEDDKNMILDYGLMEEKKIKIIRGSGVNTDKYLYVPENNSSIRVILPGRMLWDKGIGEFIAAAKKLTKEGTEATFHLYGNTDPKNPRSISEEQLDIWNQEPNIFYEGFSDDMISVYEEANIVCLPSYREGLPKTLLEAASIGRPIVASDAPGCREIVNDGENGYLVPVKDVDTLAKRLKDLIDAPNLRKEFGRNGRKKVLMDLSIDHVVEQTLVLYKHLLS